MMSSPQDAFQRLISHEPEQADFKDLKMLALAIWYEEFTPDVTHVSGYEAQVTCYLLERLIRFNCVSDSRYYELECIIKLIEKKLVIVPSSGHKISKFARKWGLNSDMTALIHKLLPYQRRHYRYEP
ncbi:hypothetical protein L1D24_00755 [Vibrio brasiliensis]|uniref:hypothetical protein n=1 Tax=Vibrio brasiliensis TaxID=170652 RepID=UPI001EFDD9A5|nr:hypothetical protein [Vibrio brasiliensis]MCG9647090.1 hypothetical protein [Vibrio brasiliensis]